jgi:hypothetical protein
LSVATRSLWISTAFKPFRLRYITIDCWSIEITNPFSDRRSEDRRRAHCVLKNGNWNIQDILLAQSLLHERCLGLIAKQAQRSMRVIPVLKALKKDELHGFRANLPTRELVRRDCDALSPVPDLAVTYKVFRVSPSHKCFCLFSLRGDFFPVGW